MKEIMDKVADLDAAAAHTIAAGMRAVARVDGVHPAEEALIDAFEADLPAGARELNFETLVSEEAKEAFLKSCVLVALVDGQLTSEETSLLGGYAMALGYDQERLAQITHEVAVSLLSQFADVKAFRDQVLQIGAELGLDESTVEAVLS